MSNETGKPAFVTGAYFVCDEDVADDQARRGHDWTAGTTIYSGSHCMLVAEVNNRIPSEWLDGTAHLLAAAPALYEALAALEDNGLLESLIGLDEGTLDDGDEPFARPLVEQARAALRAARPETPAPEGEGGDV